MITLNDIFPAWWDITALTVEARRYNTEFVKRFVFSEDVRKTRHQIHDEEEGKTRFIEGRINVHGEPNKRGLPETGWGVDEKRIPVDIRNAEIIHMNARPAAGGGTHLHVHVFLAPLQVELIDRRLDRKEEECTTN